MGMYDINKQARALRILFFVGIPSMLLAISLAVYAVVEFLFRRNYERIVVCFASGLAAVTVICLIVAVCLIDRIKQIAKMSNELRKEDLFFDHFSTTGTFLELLILWFTLVVELRKTADEIKNIEDDENY